MNDSKQEFLHSLDLPEQEVETYIPYILKDLWELGSMPDYVIQLIRENIDPVCINRITDFGCGKGAVLIKLAREIEFEGLGIDIVPEFIASAQKYARSNKVADRIKFQTGDIKNLIADIQDNDLVIYGYDSGLLGNIEESLLQLKNCIRKERWIILETAYTPDQAATIEGLPTEVELYRQIDASGLHKIDWVLWDKKKLIEVNSQNNKYIQSRIDELVANYPDKTQLFINYMDNQIQECKQMENDIICSTWLLRK